MLSISEESETWPKSISSNSSLTDFPDFTISCNAILDEFLVRVFAFTAFTKSAKC